jgi:hypothetical protein
MTGGPITVATGATPSSDDWNEIARQTVIPVDNAGMLGWGSVPTGAFVFNTDQQAYYSYNGSDWIMIGGRRIGCRLTRNALQSLPDSSEIAVQWDTAAQDTDAFITSTPPTVANIDTVTIPSGFDGLYMAVAYVYFSTGIGSVPGYVKILQNGTGGFESSAAAGGVRGTVSAQCNLSGGDHIKVVAWQASGAGIDMTARLQLFRMGP